MTRRSVKRATLIAMMAVIAPLASLGAASPAMATPKGIFSIFSDCPLATFKALGVPPSVALCSYNQTTSGEVAIGSTKVPINQTITLQGGAIPTGNPENEVEYYLLPGANGESISKTELNVPGGLLDFVNCEEIKGSGILFVVIGLGLIGLLVCQILSAAGCKVLGCDFDPERLRLAEQFGAEVLDLSGSVDPVPWVLSRTKGRGADGVLIAASTDSSDPVKQAAQMSRQRGRVVLVGVAGLELSRADFYEKELTFQVSCSYGPGRYDSNYTEGGSDYPLGFVRWTAQRNFEAVLQMLASGRLKVEPLITRRYAFSEARAAYRTLLDDAHALGIVLEYERDTETAPPNSRMITLLAEPASAPTREASISFLGAGNYASRVLIPCFAKTGAELRVLVNTGSIQGASAAGRHGFSSLASDPEVAFDDHRVGAIVIATRHDSHASLAIRAIEAGKHVFVEKPLALDLQSLDAVQATLLQQRALGGAKQFVVGFNRRFAPLGIRMRALLARCSGPKSLIYTVNAGAIPPEHWTQDPAIGGGRIVGECCHFIDFLRFLVGAPIEEFNAQSISSGGALGDTATITLRFGDGSIGTVHYFANGSRAFAKERVEAFASGKTIQLNNFRRLQGFGWGAAPKLTHWRQDKGQQHQIDEFVKRIEQGGAPLIPAQEIFEVMRISILAQQAIDAQ